MLVSSSPAINTHFCCPHTHTQKAMLTLAPLLVYREGNKPGQFGWKCLSCALPVWPVQSTSPMRSQKEGIQVDEAGNSKGEGVVPTARLQLWQAASWSSQGLFFCSTVWKVRCDTIAGSDDLAFLLHSERAGRDLPATWLSCLWRLCH